jgi:hypothetical protein
VTPFIGNNQLLIYHALIIPFIILHWLLNENTCFLTIMERKIKYEMYGVLPNKTDCISHKLVAPIYDFADDNKSLEIFIYMITISLWMVTIYKLYYRYKNNKYKSIVEFIRG